MPRQEAQRDLDARRAAEKQRDRDEDARVVSSGAKSPAQINRENGLGPALMKMGLRAGRPASL